MAGSSNKRSGSIRSTGGAPNRIALKARPKAPPITKQDRAFEALTQLKVAEPIARPGYAGRQAVWLSRKDMTNARAEKIGLLSGSWRGIGSQSGWWSAREMNLPDGRMGYSVGPNAASVVYRPRIGSTVKRRKG